MSLATWTVGGLCDRSRLGVKAVGGLLRLYTSVLPRRSGLALDLGSSA